jgi:hypothetical protein
MEISPNAGCCMQCGARECEMAGLGCGFGHFAQTRCDNELMVERFLFDFQGILIVFASKSLF